MGNGAHRLLALHQRHMHVVIGKARFERLDGDPALGDLVAGEINLAHAPASEHLLDPVGVVDEDADLEDVLRARRRHRSAPRAHPKKRAAGYPWRGHQARPAAPH